MTYDVSEQVEISFSIVQEVGRLAEMSIQGSVKPDSANLLEEAWDWEGIWGHWRFKCFSFGVWWKVNKQTNRQKTNKQTNLL